MGEISAWLRLQIEPRNRTKIKASCMRLKRRQENAASILHYPSLQGPFQLGAGKLGLHLFIALVVFSLRGISAEKIEGRARSAPALVLQRRQSAHHESCGGDDKKALVAIWKTRAHLVRLLWILCVMYNTWVGRVDIRSIQLCTALQYRYYSPHSLHAQNVAAVSISYLLLRAFFTQKCFYEMAAAVDGTGHRGATLAGGERMMAAFPRREIDGENIPFQELHDGSSRHSRSADKYSLVGSLAHSLSLSPT